MLGSRNETGRSDPAVPARVRPQRGLVLSMISVLTICLALTVPAQAQDAPPTEATVGSPEAEAASSSSDEVRPESPSAPPRPAVEDTEYGVRLRGLEERVNELKERVFRSKARLLLLRETVLNGVISGARARILHVNDVGSAFNLEEVTYALDGSPLFAKSAEDGNLDDQREIELFSGSIVPGNHNISLSMRFRGNGYGVFSYLRAYTFNVQSSYAFTAEEGKLTTVKAVAYEKGGFTTDLQERLAIRYDVEVKRDAPAPDADPKAAP